MDKIMNKTLYVSGLNKTVDEAGLRQIFKSHGTVELISIPINKIIDKPKGYAFVEMSTPEEAQKCITNLNDTTINDSKITVQLKKPQISVDVMNKTLYLSGLDNTVDQAGLKRIFGQHGTVESASIPTDKKTNQAKGYGFVEMSTLEEAQECINQLNGTTLNDSQITVEFRKQNNMPSVE